MLLQTILNRVEKHPSFVYDAASFPDDGNAIEVEIRERANGPPTLLRRLLSLVRVLDGVIGVLAALTGLFAGLAFALGTWIS